jgi:predicted nucleotidyltransferase component of viral defense system
MKDRLRAIVAESRGVPTVRHVVREYVQHYILYLLFRTRHYRELAFTGGTALRVLFGLPRFSEDLDFSLAGVVRPFRFDAICADLLSELAGAGYDVSERRREQGAVVSTFIKFPGLLSDLGLSPHAGEAMSVRVEVDTNPPAGGAAGLGLVNRYHLLYSVWRHDLPTLFAGKLHALLFRPYERGRDVYDLLWFLTTQQETAPNLDFLNNAALQTESAPPVFTVANWRGLLAERLARMDLRRAREQVRPFLERPEEADLMTPESFAALLAP